MSDNDKQQSMLRKVEGLLAKAESTEFEEERQACMDMAQQLMTKYSIEDAMLRKATGVVDVPIEHVQINMDQIKYSKALSILIGHIARVNDCYAVLTPKSGNQRGYAFVTIFGTPASLDCVLMLVTSLHRQLEIAVRDTPIPEGVHGKTFRNNFVLSFASTVGKRLQQSKDETLRGETVKGMELVLVNQYEKAGEGAREMFPNMGTASGPSGKFDAAGSSAGRQAGERASLSRGEIG